MTGKQLKKIREGLGLSQAAFATLVGHAGDRKTVYRWEEGKINVPGAVAILARMLKADPHALDAFQK